MTTNPVPSISAEEKSRGEKAQSQDYGFAQRDGGFVAWASGTSPLSYLLGVLVWGRSWPRLVTLGWELNLPEKPPMWPQAGALRHLLSVILGTEFNHVDNQSIDRSITPT